MTDTYRFRPESIKIKPRKNWFIYFLWCKINKNQTFYKYSDVRYLGKIAVAGRSLVCRWSVADRSLEVNLCICAFDWPISFRERVSPPPQLISLSSRSAARSGAGSLTRGVWFYGSDIGTERFICIYLWWCNRTGFRAYQERRVILFDSVSWGHPTIGTYRIAVTYPSIYLFLQRQTICYRYLARHSLLGARLTGMGCSTSIIFVYRLSMVSW